MVQSWVLLGQNFENLNSGSILIRNGKIAKNSLKFKFYAICLPFKQVKVNFQKWDLLGHAHLGPKWDLLGICVGIPT